jgi:NAD(P)-dependent dehydrogenase (short-subunit alcohol dehydrogenase family)
LKLAGAWIPRRQRGAPRAAAPEIDVVGFAVSGGYAGEADNRSGRRDKAQRVGKHRRVVDATEIAFLVAFLASPKSVAINGETIAAGGGTLGPINY